MSATCDGCGMDFTDEEISAYLDKVLCRKCYPRTISPRALRETKEQSPYMAFALSMLMPGAGHAYAGRLAAAYLLNFAVYVPVMAAAPVAAAHSSFTFLVVLAGLVIVIPLVAVAIAAHAVGVSRRVRGGELPAPRSLRPLLVFMAVGLATLLLVGVALAGSVAIVFQRGDPIF